MIDSGQALEVVEEGVVVVIGGLDRDELEVLGVEVVGGVVLDLIENFVLLLELGLVVAVLKGWLEVLVLLVLLVVLLLLVVVLLVLVGFFADELNVVCTCAEH
jgi:phosphotransferase system  glucose/maltose/N-acetylglucosamine-specific IIC component